MSQYDFYQHKECEYFPAIRELIRKPLAAYSAIAPCMRWAIAAAVISSIRRGESRIAPTVCALTAGKTTPL